MEGVVFEVTDGGLEMADDYEAGDYQWVQAPLGFGELEGGAGQTRAAQAERHEYADLPRSGC